MFKKNTSTWKYKLRIYSKKNLQHVASIKTIFNVRWYNYKRIVYCLAICWIFIVWRWQSIQSRADNTATAHDIIPRNIYITHKYNLCNNTVPSHVQQTIAKHDKYYFKLLQNVQKK
eukprot:863498_1